MSARFRRVAFRGATLALMASASQADAAPTARLVYSRAADAASCPDETSLRRAVSLRIGYDVFFPWAQRTVVVAIVRRREAFVATVSLVDENGIDHGAHELHTGATCGDLLDTVALAVAIAVDPQSVLAKPAPKPDAPPPPEAPTPVAMPLPLAIAEPTAESPPPPPPVTGAHLEGSLGALLSLGMAPSAAIGATVGVDGRWSRFSIGLEGAIDAPSSKAASGGRVSAWLTYGALIPCAYVGPLFGCAIAQAGALESSGQGLTHTHSASNGWWALGGRVGGLYSVTNRLFLRARLDFVGDLRPTSIELAQQIAWPAPPVAASLGIDAVLRFW